MSATGDGVPLDDGSMEHASYDETGAAEALEADAAPVRDGPSADTAGHGAPMEFDGQSVSADMMAELYGTIGELGSLPMCNGERTMPNEGNAGNIGVTVEPERPGLGPAGEGSEAAAEAPAAPLNYDSAYQWAVRMFAVGSDAAIDIGGDAVLADAPVGVCCMVKQVVQDLYRNQPNDIGRSPERPDLRLSQEEAQGYLVGNLVIGELLAHEGRAVGKRVDNVVAKENKDAAAAKEAAKGPRKKARALQDDEAREAALKAIDDDLEAQRARRLRAAPTVSLQLPPRRTVVVESKPKVLKPEAAEGRLRLSTSSHDCVRPPLAPRPPCCQRRRTPSPPNAVLSVRSRRARTWPLIHLTTPSQELRCLCPNPASPMRPTRLTIGRTTSSLPSGRRSMRAWPGCVRNAMLPTRLQTTRATQLSSRAMLSQKRSARVPRWRRLPSVLPSGLPRRKSGGASERRARPGWPPPARTSRLLRPGFLA